MRLAEVSMVTHFRQTMNFIWEKGFCGSKAAVPNHSVVFLKHISKILEKFGFSIENT